MKRAAAVVDLGAIRANLDRVRALAGNATVMAVVKADAYGHGMAAVARTLRQADVAWLGVALPSEALALRAQGDEGRVLAWLWAPGDPDIVACVRAGVDLSVSSPWAVLEVAEAARRTGVSASIHIKVDTGLYRNGATEDQLPAVIDAVRAALAEGLVQVEGVWSHLADGDVAGAHSVAQQQAAFEAAIARLDEAGIRPRLRHLGNSGSLWAHPECRYDMVRSGIALYGLTPAAGLGSPRELGLVPAMTLAARLAHVKGIAVGGRVSYGGTWEADRDTAVGLVPVGYADGIPRAASNVAEVAIDGVRVPVVGRIAMDQFVVDLGAQDLPRVGDDVIVFGPGSRGEWTADEWASAIGTIGYEIVTRIGPRVMREYVGAMP
ncbi:MAG: alanine racemase [Actinomycetales bacterium]|nr:alanine racemase [Actinomycetales bacterium]